MTKNKKDRKLKFKKIEEVKDTIPSFLKSNYIIYAILSFILALSLYIRIVLPWDITFANGITLIATDDAVYHMRLVENLVANFPHRLSFDPYTLYPYGALLSWGSFYDLIIGTLVIIFGTQNINLIGALVPAIMGALVVIPVYFIGTELLNKKAGLFGAFIVAIIPGSFLIRSMLGFTDHHVAEVLFSTIFMMYFIFAFNRVKHIPEKLFNIKSLKFIISTPLKYAVLSGIFLGLYLLTWTTGLLFAGIVTIFLVIQIFINYYTNKSNDLLITITTITYGISALIVLPFIDLRNGFGVVFYSPTHVISLLGIILMCLILNYISLKMKKEKCNTYKFVGIIIILFIILIAVVKVVFPLFYSNTIGSLDIVFNAKSGGGLTIGEAQPTDILTIYNMFRYNFIFFVISMMLLIIYLIKENKEKYLIAIIWSTFILLILLAQNRFSYYFAINVAILSGFLCGYSLDYVGRFKDIKNLNIFHVISLLIVIFVVGFYPIGSSPYEISTQSGKYGFSGGDFYNWYESMTWMRNNTPETGLDYYKLYERPEEGESFKYPETAYGVMSWWDYGHMITYWAHRIPNADPFQFGIGGGKNHIAGASTFLTAPSEEEANNVLGNLSINGKPGAKYVVSNARMAYSIQPIFARWNEDESGYYMQIRTSQGTQIVPTEKYYNTMESKLHILDGNGLKTYRLVHESAQNPYVDGGAQELGYKQVYNILINKNNPIPLENSGFIKIFEYVKGVNIFGTTTPNSEVTIELHIVTNIGRPILYKQTTISDSEGNYILTVPYSTTGTIIGETQFDTKSQGNYHIYNGDNPVLSVIVNEKDVLEGRTIIVGE